MSVEAIPVKAMYKGVRDWSDEKEMKLRKFHAILQMQQPEDRLKIADAVEQAIDIATDVLIIRMKDNS